MVYLGTHPVKGIAILTNVGHILWQVFLEMLAVSGIPGYTSCKGYSYTYKCWTYPVAGVPRNAGRYSVRGTYTSCKYPLADEPRNVGYTYSLLNVDYLACFT